MTSSNEINSVTVWVNPEPCKHKILYSPEGGFRILLQIGEAWKPRNRVKIYMRHQEGHGGRNRERGIVASLSIPMKHKKVSPGYSKVPSYCSSTFLLQFTRYSKNIQEHEIITEVMRPKTWLCLPCNRVKAAFLSRYEMKFKNIKYHRCFWTLVDLIPLCTAIPIRHILPHQTDAPMQTILGILSKPLEKSCLIKSVA